MAIEQEKKQRLEFPNPDLKIRFHVGFFALVSKFEVPSSEIWAPGTEKHATMTQIIFSLFVHQVNLP